MRILAVPFICIPCFLLALLSWTLIIALKTVGVHVFMTAFEELMMLIFLALNSICISTINLNTLEHLGLFVNSYLSLTFYLSNRWTFTLVTVYFGLASSLSIIGYLRYHLEVEPESTTDNADHGSYVPPILGEGTDTALETGSLNCYCEPKFKTVASVWGYALQIIFQVSNHLSL
ncbi:hypothetical protein ACS0TY_003908 [Phlomoides rotata]